MKLYGVANCDTVKKARAWLAAHHIEIEFQDFKKFPPNRGLLEKWLRQTSWEKLVNRQGTTWRKLSDEQKTAVAGAAAALALMLEKPTVIKRPLLERDGRLLHLGFDEATYNKLLKKEK